MVESRFVTRVSPPLPKQVHSAPAQADYMAPFVQAAADTECVEILDKMLSEEDLLKLRLSTNAYISLHRAEGLGLNIMQVVRRLTRFCAPPLCLVCKTCD